MDYYEKSCKVSTWLCQIAKHLLYQYWAKDNRMQLEELSESYESDTNTEQQAIACIELADVWDRLQKLPLEMKKVVELRVLGDLSYGEIGNILGMSEAKARVTFFRAKMILIKEGNYGKDEL
ncbi:MAG: sigma-70 family RNA polymerase sigma factor [Lachnospiraceae bacterium]|nr:sigma-70 family RNA polymerase sigma factor [Lachnospiraceae bacterium]